MTAGPFVPPPPPPDLHSIIDEALRGNSLADDALKGSDAGPFH